MNLSLVAPINNLSYGIVSVNILHELIKLGHRVSLFPINPHNIEAHPKFHTSIREALKNAEMPVFEADCIRIWHQNDMSQFVGRGKHIGFPIFELDKFTEQERHHLDSCDRLFVCSEWARDVIFENGLSEWKTYITPLGVDSEIFYPAKSYRKQTIFLNCGKYEKRKGHDILIEAFCKAFRPEDNVELWMLPHNPFNTEEENKRWTDLYQNNPMGHKVKIFPHQNSQQEISDIMRQADIGVFPYRAEGWCMPLLEMMSCGKEVIASYYSAPTEYLDPNIHTCLYSKGNELEPAEDGKWFFKQGSWLKIDETYMQSLVHHMKVRHEAKQKNISTINSENVEISKRFSWSNSAKRIIESL